MRDIIYVFDKNLLEYHILIYLIMSKYYFLKKLFIDLVFG